ncbi:hypothetical protein NEMBOFW57_009265 [Staphylotrichum longicolle]|uniref:Prolyl 4-hydroxylase alpha subunit domain-containing protein n=1 Tax=Staphylotrichum longicolle TaxID=669026 RepID=A0AAD4HUN9_9PEZI|nr:hypothetical protein NEMBOFW57_009265 [Staphylotrichum longicolle]
MPSIRSLLTTLGGVAFLNSAVALSDLDHSQQAPLTSNDYVCEHPPYKVHLVSHSPLIIYIQDFVTPSERAHLLNLSESTFTRSGTTSNTSASALRTSQSTTLPPSDAVVACIESRALAFQGLDSTPRSHLEPLQLVRYAPTEHYHFHTDWFPSPAHAAPDMGGNRVSSFFVIYL